MGVRSEKVSFEGSAGTLAARLDLPPGTPRAFALFAHCFTCSKDVFAASRIAQGLADQGIATLRFDFTGLGASDGEFANTNFSSNIEDLLAAARYLAENHEAPALLVGHSLGGAAVLATASKLDSVKAIATIGAPFEPIHVSHNFGGSIHEIEAQGEAEVSIGGRPFTVKKQFLDDLASHDPAADIGAIRAALLVCHAPRDEIVGIENATQIFVTAKHPKSFLSLDSADHLLTRREDAEYLAGVLSSWAARYLGLGRPARPQTKLRPAEGDTITVETGAGKFTTYIEAGGHKLSADEPLAYGGDNTGPSPYDLLLASLGACTSMTMRMYATHKKIPLERVAIKLSHEKIHAEDCADCETKEGKIDFIAREIEVTGELDEGQRQGLLRIADKCPVHRTLHSEVKIDSRLTE